MCHYFSSCGKYFWVSYFPDSTPYANQMHLELSKQSPGFEVDIILLHKDDVEQISFLKK